MKQYDTTNKKTLMREEIFSHEKGNFSRNGIIFQFVRTDKRSDGLLRDGLSGNGSP